MFENKRMINGKPYHYLEHSYRIGRKVRKITFHLPKGGKFDLNDFRKINERQLKENSGKITDYIKENRTFSRFFSYGNQIQTIEEGKIVFSFLNKFIDEKEKEQIISEYVRKFLVNSMAMEGGTLTYNDATAIDSGKMDAKIKGTIKDKRLYLQLKKASKMLMNGRLRTKEQIKKIHKVIYNQIYEFAGRFKTEKNTFGGMEKAITTEPKDVPKALAKAILRFHAEKNKLYNFERIVNFHINYQKIHPFEDGNSRLGRLIMNIQLIKAGYPPLIYEHKRSSAYRQALVTAVNDPHKNTPILKFFYDNYKRSFNKFWKPLIEKHIVEKIKNI